MDAAGFWVLDSIIEVWRKQTVCKRGCYQQWCVRRSWQPFAVYAENITRRSNQEDIKYQYILTDVENPGRKFVLILVVLIVVVYFTTWIRRRKEDGNMVN